jgi:hypothetical protein
LEYIEKGSLRRAFFFIIFMLLYEPANHVDIKSIEWLEGFLINYKGDVVLVSHDRAFLDQVTKIKKNFFFLIVYTTFADWIKKKTIEKFFSI